MTLSAQPVFKLEPIYGHFSRTRRLHVGLAVGEADIRAAQRLRHQVFVEEMGAALECKEPGIESDFFDAYCQHLIVRDVEQDRVVGCYRILTDTEALRAGGYYSQSEFDLTRVLAIPGRFMEVGRTCVHPDYRNGATIGMLWAGLARFMTMNNYQYLMGCASIPMSLGVKQISAICHYLRQYHLSPAEWRVFPRVPVPFLGEQQGARAIELPPLLRGYMKLGALVCGEPAWDPDFNVADIFILLDVERLNVRYMRHYVDRV